MNDFNLLMEFLENNLLADNLIADAAKKLGISDYHLKRTFIFVAGISLSEYIKTRRLVLANEELAGGAPVTDVAFKYGYNSVEGFSRAFKSFSGYLPSQVQKNKILTSYPKLTFNFEIRGGVSMEYKIEHKDGFFLYGVTKVVPIKFEGVNPAIVELAKSITADQRAEMHELADLYPKQVLNASYDFDNERMEEKGNLTHFIGFASSVDTEPKTLTKVEVPEQTWAVFPSKGEFPKVFQETWANIFAEWLPISGYELVAAPEISFTKYDGEKSDLYSEIWVAVKKK